MKVIIVGCGRVGSRIGINLFHQGHDVSIIDRNPLAFDKLLSCFDGRMIQGTGIDEDVLKNAGIEDCDALISVAKGDNTNIMVGQIAKFLFKVPKVIIKIVDPKAKMFYENEIGLTCFCTVEVSANGIASLL
jgi:trk system potassium uptake protein